MITMIKDIKNVNGNVPYRFADSLLDNSEMLNTVLTVIVDLYMTFLLLVVAPKPTVLDLASSSFDSTVSFESFDLVSVHQILRI